MKRFGLAIALTGLMFMTALAGNIPTNDVVAPPPPPTTSESATTSAALANVVLVIVTLLGR
jgi:hypothetical protein